MDEKGFPPFRFDGKTACGTWIFRVEDWLAGDVGSVSFLEIEFTGRLQDDEQPIEGSL